MSIIAHESDQNQNNASEAQFQSFLSDIHESGLADLFQAKNVYQLTPISVLKSRYIHGKLGAKSAARSQAFLAVSDLKNSDGRIAAYYLAIAAKGYRGLCCTNEQIAELVEAASGAKCSDRTVSRVNAALKQLGFITVKPLPTGSKYLNSDGKWKTKRVNQIFLTGLAWLILKPADTYTSLPSPKRLPIVERNLDSPPIGGESLDYQCNDNTNSGTIAVCPTYKGDKVDPTCSPQAASGAHKASTGKRQAALPQGKVTRKRRAKVYSELRHKFLHELIRELGESPESSEIFKLAERQTSPNFPALVPTVLDWDRLLWQWPDRQWHVRRKSLRKNIIPALAAAVALLIPPDSSRANDPSIPVSQRRKIQDRLRHFKNASAWQKTLSSQLASKSYPEGARNLAKDNSFLLDMYSGHLNTGRISPNELPSDVAKLFSDLAEMVGIE